MFRIVNPNNTVCRIINPARRDSGGSAWNGLSTFADVSGIAASGLEYFSGKTRIGDNFKIYQATQSGRVFYGNQYVNTVGVSAVGRGFGASANVVSTALSYRDIAQGNSSAITYVDAGVGTTAILSSVVSYAAGINIPVVGQGAALYGWTRFWYDMGRYYGPSTWYGKDNTKWFK